MAYFKGDIRRCRYEIEWYDENGKRCRTYAAIRGPVETKIDYIQKHSISVDNPNFSPNSSYSTSDKLISGSSFKYLHFKSFVVPIISL